jgi:hypothetical protein
MDASGEAISQYTVYGAPSEGGEYTCSFATPHEGAHVMRGDDPDDAVTVTDCVQGPTGCGAVVPQPRMARGSSQVMRPQRNVSSADFVMQSWWCGRLGE